MTYEGPSDSATASGQSQDGFYHTGSALLEEVLYEASGFLVGHIHSHSYIGASQDAIRRFDFVETPIVNTGVM